MRIFRLAVYATLAFCTASAAWAQYGLYGSPDTLQFPQSEATQTVAAPPVYPTTATPMPDYAAQPANRYAPQPMYRQYPAPQYTYPAQSASSAMFQPQQPGAQYRYPGPATRPTLRTASVGPTAQGQPTGAYPAPSPAPAAMPDVPEPGLDPATQPSGMMNQMLADQPCNAYGANGCGVYQGAGNQFDQSACAPNNGCGYDMCGQACFCPWYASAQALIMGRSDARRFWTSYDDSDETIQLSNSQIPLAWKWGGEIRLGRRFCCTCVPYAVEAIYWTTDAFTGSQTTSIPGGLVSTPLNLQELNFGVNPATDWFMGAQSQTVSRRDELHNLEINLIREQLAWAANSPWDIGWSVGVRYFRFQENLTFASLAFDGVSDAFFSDQITNDLVGAQFGFDAAYNIGGRVRAFITPKVGIYDNFITSNFEARAKVGNGAYVDGVGPYGSFPVRGSTTAISFLTQIDVGADWQITRNWSARAGYRVVAITGMGLADDQFPQYMCDTPEIVNVQNPSSLLIHGAFLGATYNF